jgi:hypothetical protein
MMMTPMNPLVTVVAKGVITVAAFGTGIYLYNRYKKDKRRMLGMTAGMIAGHKLGAAAGGIVAGPIGAMAGMTAGCLTGCMVGGSLVERDDEECCEESPAPSKARKVS